MGSGGIAPLILQLRKMFPIKVVDLNEMYIFLSHTNDLYDELSLRILLKFNLDFM